MVVWSSPIIRNTIMAQCRNLARMPKYNVGHCKGLNLLQVRTCKGHSGVFHMVSSDFQWNKFKDMFHFYLMIGGIPALCIILYCNIFIGPATLTPIPEGYKPKDWEYHRHPISRFLCRYVTENPQKVYEKMCFFLFYNRERTLVREVERKVKQLMAERGDFQAWYYTPAMTKYARHHARAIEDMAGNNYKFPLRT